MAFDIGILGSGGQADEAESYLSGDVKAVFRAVNKEYLSNDKPFLIDISNPSNYEKSSSVLAAVGTPTLREAMVNQWPGSQYATIQAENSYVDASAEIGEGSIIAPGAVITTNVKIGNHNIINVSATISHNSLTGDFVTVSPGAHIAGNVTLGDGVFIGIGATVSNRVKIAAGSVIGAGAVVMDDINIENSVVVGVPAKTIRINEGWLNEL